MRIINLAFKDLLQILRDWRAAVFLLVMPIAFTLMFGFAFGGFGDDEQGDSRFPVLVIDQDQEELSSKLLELLEESKVIAIEVTEMEPDEARQMVADGEVAGAVIVPGGYSEAFLSQDSAILDVVADQGISGGNAVVAEVQGAAGRLRSAVLTADLSRDIYDRESGFAGEGDRQAYYEDAVDRTLDAWKDPPITVTTLQSQAVESEEGEESGSVNAYTQSSPGMMAQFSIAGLMGASAILVMERKSRAMRRLLTTATTRTEILVGHFIAMFVMIFVQLAILIIFGQLLLRLNYFDHLAATIVMAAATALFSASLGLLIGALAKSEEQVIVYAMIPMFVLSGLGGAWVPLEIMPEGFRQFAQITPLAFVMSGFQDILIRDLGLEAVLLNAIVLVGLSVVLFVIAAWIFKYE